MMLSHSRAILAIISILNVFGNIDRVSGVEKSCGLPTDIALVLDSSNSVGPGAFNHLNQFLKNLVSTFKISPEEVRFALLTFGHQVNTQHVFNFADYTDEESLLNQIDRVRWVEGKNTRTDLAVKYARKKFFPTARPGVKKIEIIITDGRVTPTYEKALASEISATKKSNVTIFALGVGHSISLQDLKAMASSMKYVFQVSSYAALDEIKDIMAATACPTPPPKTKPCGDKDTDVIFTMDSWRMNVEDVRGVFDFMMKVISESGIDYEGFLVGMLTGKCINYRGFDLGEFVDKDQIGNYLDNLGYASVKPLMTELYTEAFLPKRGGRKGARRVGVIVVPSKLRDPIGLLQEAIKAKINGVELFAIGIGQADQKLLTSIASSKSHIITVDKPSALTSLSSDFVKKLCEKPKTTASPPVTKKPTPKPTTKKPGC